MNPNTSTAPRQHDQEDYVFLRRSATATMGSFDGRQYVGKRPTTESDEQLQKKIQSHKRKGFGFTIGGVALAAASVLFPPAGAVLGIVGGAGMIIKGVMEFGKEGDSRDMVRSVADWRQRRQAAQEDLQRSASPGYQQPAIATIPSPRFGR